MEAEKESQKSGENDKEWMQDKCVLKKIIQHFQFYAQTDLFISKLNKQLSILVLYKPDSEATCIYTLSFKWGMKFN